MNDKQKKILLKSIRVINPINNFDSVSDVVINGKKIVSIKKPNSKNTNEENMGLIYDCKNLILCPGLIDMKVHLNGLDQENITKTQNVASKAGVLKLVVASNQDTMLDDPTIIEQLYEKSKDSLKPTIFCYGSATKNLDGLQISELGLMSESGAIGFTDGVNCIQDSLVMRRIMSYASMFGKPVIQHAEDRSLAGLSQSNTNNISGEINEGEISTRLGLIGIPSCAEAIIIERDLRLAKLTNAHYHVSNISTQEAVEVIKRGKKEGIKITCDTSPPYFSLNELELLSYKTSFKLSPPLRNEKDRISIAQAIKEGIIDVITSNHFPRSNDTKLLPFSSASVGACGLETLLPLTLSLVKQGLIDLITAISMLTIKPARLLKLDIPNIQEDSIASFIIVDPDKSVIIDENKLLTSPTPFHGRVLEGFNLATFLNGKIIYETNEFKNLKNV